MTELRLDDQWWRLNNLYYITDKQGRKVKFKPNWAQKQLFNKMWYLNIILKARQLGMTTFIQLFMLDVCLFNDNQTAGVIAHNREDAEDFFDK
ncbi:terminase, partial [Porticoccaceae bacterium]|nr:terminase [Porticoccaceae bacterium]